MGATGPDATGGDAHEAEAARAFVGVADDVVAHDLAAAGEDCVQHVIRHVVVDVLRRAGRWEGVCERRGGGRRGRIALPTLM